MNVIDIGIILIVIMFLIVGFKNGVIKELASLIGMVLVFGISYIFKGVLGNFLCTICPFIEFNSGPLKGLVTMNILIYQVIAFLLLFVILLSIYELIIGFSKVIQKIINMTIILIIPSKLLGALVGMIKGLIIIYAVLLVLIIPFKNMNLVETSKLSNLVLYHTPIISSVTEDFTTSLREVYKLTNQVSKKKISTNEANKKALDIMLKYKIVSKETVQKLIAEGKLNSIKNIDKVLEKY